MFIQVQPQKEGPCLVSHCKSIFMLMAGGINYGTSSNVIPFSPFRWGWCLWVNREIFSKYIFSKKRSGSEQCLCIYKVCFHLWRKTDQIYIHTNTQHFRGICQWQYYFSIKTLVPKKEQTKGYVTSWTFKSVASSSFWSMCTGTQIWMMKLTSITLGLCKVFCFLGVCIMRRKSHPLPLQWLRLFQPKVAAVLGALIVNRYVRDFSVERCSSGFMLWPGFPLRMSSLFGNMSWGSTHERQIFLFCPPCALKRVAVRDCRRKQYCRCGWNVSFLFGGC